jgi:hypothetical protein
VKMGCRLCTAYNEKEKKLHRQLLPTLIKEKEPLWYRVP